MILFLRGLPGTGKTTIANVLAAQLQWDVVHVDALKKEYMEAHPGADFRTVVVPASYDKALEVLQGYTFKNVIVEEVFRDEAFVRRVLDFCDQNNVQYQWFKIIRDKEHLLEVNDERRRAIQNNPAILDSMERKMNAIVLEGEIDIHNQTLEDSVQKILETI